jgi:transcriptional regulator GlxA family with amidase domain
VTDAVEAGLGGRLSLDRLAAEARLSKDRFTRRFRASFGVAPSAYIARRRLARARALMIQTDAPLAAIALDCGFSDQAHLSRKFRAQAGEPPAGWRRRNRTPERI